MDRWNGSKKYLPNGKVEADDFKGFSKFIKVNVSVKEAFKNKPGNSPTQTIECYVKDAKAHSFSDYPYPDEILIKEGREKGEYISDSVEEAHASVLSGLVQTGIKYPNVKGKNRLVVAGEHMDASIVEFCGDSISGLGFKIDEYNLEYIEVNYENTTKGE